MVAPESPFRKVRSGNGPGTNPGTKIVTVLSGRKSLWEKSGNEVGKEPAFGSFPKSRDILWMSLSGNAEQTLTQETP